MKIPLFKPTITEEMKKAVIEALDSDMLVRGRSVKLFENMFSKYIGTRYSVSVSSGTNALQLCLEALRVRGKEVITTPYTFIATSNSILHAGGTPVFVDIDKEGFTIDPEGIESSITDKTAGIIPVHLYGFPCRMKEIKNISKENEVFVLEDACQAHGSSYMGKKVGSLGVAGCFSFYPTKNMTVGGDGGMVTTDDLSIADKVSKLGNCGRKNQYLHDMIGYTSRLNSINAVIGIEQLKLLDSWNKRKKELVAIYRENLNDVGDLVLPIENNDSDVAYGLFVIRSSKRDKLKTHLESKGIGCGVYYPTPLHLQPTYKCFGLKKGAFPNSEKLSKENLAVPIHHQISDEDIDFVIRNIRDFFEK